MLFIICAVRTCLLNILIFCGYLLRDFLDEGEQIPIQTHAPSPTNASSDDVNIHVHKEGGTGGGICAKLVFFVLLSALVVVLGMIITQYRGLTDGKYPKYLSHKKVITYTKNKFLA